jgi:hypothetical protein
MYWIHAKLYKSKFYPSDFSPLAQCPLAVHVDVDSPTYFNYRQFKNQNLVH